MVTKLRTPREERKKRKPPHCEVTAPAWLTRCELMGYEIWSEKPERTENGGFCVPLGWTTINQTNGFYLRLPSMDDTLEGSPLYLHLGAIRRINIHIDLTGRGRPIHAEDTEIKE